MALCYNREQVDKPPDTLTQWLSQARAGVGIAIEPAFLNTMWGVSAHGGKWFDRENRFLLKESAITLWLEWLKEAQKMPTVYLDARRDVLFDLFVTGKVAYYPCWSFEYVPLQKRLEIDSFGERSHHKNH